MTSPLPSGGECGCGYRHDAPAHHDRLIGLEQNPLAVLGELVDLASTWGEVDRPEPAVIEPGDWVGFVERHEWIDRDRVLELMLGLWSMTLPCRHDLELQALETQAGVATPFSFGTVVPIGAAPSAAGGMRSA